MVDIATCPVPLPGIGSARRVTLRRRWSLRGQGRLDGRLRRPDPLLLTGPVVTGVRQALLAELDQGLAIVQQRLIDGLRDLRCQLGSVQAEIAGLARGLARAEAQLSEVHRGRPDPAAQPARRLGDENQPERVVRARREREHGRKVDAARRTIESLGAAISDRHRQHAELARRMAQRREQATALADEMCALVMTQQTIYHQSLLRAHPDRELLGSLLVAAEPARPLWALAETGV